MPSSLPWERLPCSPTLPYPVSLQHRATPPDRPTGWSQDDLYLADTWNNRIRRIARDGTIMTVVKATTTTDPGALALDSHGNLYFADVDHKRVKVVVRPGELAAPSRPPPTPWLLGAEIGVPAVLLVAIGAVVVVRRKRRGTAGETLAE